MPDVFETLPAFGEFYLFDNGRRHFESRLAMWPFTYISAMFEQHEQEKSTQNGDPDLSKGLFFRL